MPWWVASGADVLPKAHGTRRSAVVAAYLEGDVKSSVYVVLYAEGERDSAELAWRRLWTLPPEEIDRAFCAIQRGPDGDAISASA